MENNDEENFSIVQEDWEIDVKIPDLADVLTKTSGIIRVDALILAGKKGGVISLGLKREKAEELVKQLKILGVSAFMVPESQLIKIPKALNITKLSGIPNVFITPPDIDKKVYSAGWENIIAVSCGFIGQVPEPSSRASGGILGVRIPCLPVETLLKAHLVSLMAAPMSTAGHMPKEKVDRLFLMDIIVKNPIARFRMDSTRFNYAELGSKMKPDAFDNFKELLQEIVSRASQAYLEKDVKMFLEKEGEPRMLIFQSLQEFDRYDNWLAQKAVRQSRQPEENQTRLL